MYQVNHLQSNAGRPQTSVRIGPGYALAEFLNDVWGRRVTETNQQVVDKLGLRSQNLISMWRTGKTRVPLEHLPGISEIVDEPLERLLSLWLEQYINDSAGTLRGRFERVECLFRRIVSVAEFKLVSELREAVGNLEFDPTTEQVRAMRRIAIDPDIGVSVIEASAASPAV